MERSSINDEIWAAVRWRKIYHYSQKTCLIFFLYLAICALYNGHLLDQTNNTLHFNDTNANILQYKRIICFQCLIPETGRLAIIRSRETAYFWKSAFVDFEFVAPSFVLINCWSLSWKSTEHDSHLGMDVSWAIIIMVIIGRLVAKLGLPSCLSAIHPWEWPNHK